MSTEYHILNGDALKEQLPKSIPGEIIIARECLVDGTVKGNNLEELFEARATFISHQYSGYQKKDYYEKTVPEIQKIQAIADQSVINLWFEDDLFCQVNFWFVVHLLCTSPTKNYSLFLIRPPIQNEYGFGGLHQSDLLILYKNRLALTNCDKLASLWSVYQKEDAATLLATAKELENTYPFILPAVEAHIARTPSNDKMGRPIESLLQIMQELDTKEFAPIFSAFNKRESIYGFGDLQVKRLLDQINEEIE